MLHPLLPRRPLLRRLQTSAQRSSAEQHQLDKSLGERKKDRSLGLDLSWQWQACVGGWVSGLGAAARSRLHGEVVAYLNGYVCRWVAGAWLGVGVSLEW